MTAMLYITEIIMRHFRRSGGALLCDCRKRSFEPIALALYRSLVFCKMSPLMENFHPLSMLLHEVQRADEDAIDRLSRKASTLLFCALAVVATMVQFTGEVIKCWAPQHFSDVWVDYVNSYCWIANTYHVSMAHTDILAAPRKEIVYYQWVPIALFLQATGFYAPSIVWSVFKRGLAVNVKRTVAMFSRPECISPSVLDDAANAIAKGFDRSLRYGRQPSQQQQQLGWSARVIGGLRGVGHCGSSATCGYLLSKVLYLLNAVLQLCALNFFLGTDYSLYGIDMLGDLVATGTYHESPRFPRVTACDFEVRSLDKRTPYTVQCTLPVNLFNEKMYVFIWFWLVAVAIASGFGVIRSVCEVLLTSRVSFVSSYLRVVGATVVDDKTEDAGGLKDEERLLVREFCREYLCHDGYFALRLIASNTNDVATSKLMHNMWNLFKQRRAQLKDKEQAAV